MSQSETIQFFQEDISFDFYFSEAIPPWIHSVLETEGCHIRHIDFIFCSDSYLHQMNVKYLDHDTLTDVITFPYSMPPEVEGDVFISVERVKENAAELGHSFEEELSRVMIHGVFHLCGFGDKSVAEEKAMRKKEDEALAILKLPAK